MVPKDELQEHERLIDEVSPKIHHILTKYLSDHRDTSGMVFFVLDPASPIYDPDVFAPLERFKFASKFVALVPAEAARRIIERFPDTESFGHLDFDSPLRRGECRILSATENSLHVGDYEFGQVTGPGGEA